MNVQLKDVTPIIKAILEERDKIPRIIDKERYIPNPQPYHDGNFIRGGIRKALRIIEQAPVVDAMPRWISVEERLPEAHADGSVDAELVTDGEFIHMAYYAHGQWIFCESGEMKEPMWNTVTHWMPLPEPPKEESTC